MSPFLFHRKMRFYEIKNVPQESHCGGLEEVAEATRHRRRILLCRILVDKNPGVF